MITNQDATSYKSVNGTVQSVQGHREAFMEIALLRTLLYCELREDFILNVRPILFEIKNKGPTQPSDHLTVHQNSYFAFWSLRYQQRHNALAYMMYIYAVMAVL